MAANGAGEGVGGVKQTRVMTEVYVERIRQDARWGDQSHHSGAEWLVILGEEFGELCGAILAKTFGDDERQRQGQDWRKEAVQVAAVAIAMLEQHE